MQRFWPSPRRGIVVIPKLLLVVIGLLATVATAADADSDIVHDDVQQQQEPPCCLCGGVDCIIGMFTTMAFRATTSGTSPASAVTSSSATTCASLHQQAASWTAHTPECRSLQSLAQALHHHHEHHDHPCCPNAAGGTNSATSSASTKSSSIASSSSSKSIIAPPPPKQQVHSTRQEYFICTVCHSGKTPVNMKMGVAVLQYPSAKNCRDLYYMGLRGDISEQMCNPLQDAMDVPWWV